MKFTQKKAGLRLLASAAVVALMVVAPAIDGSLSQAVAQTRVSVSVEFRNALEPYGRFVAHPRWGEVWRPGRVERDWKPYKFGRWAYTRDYGYYWVSDEREDDWGWIVYHYGRWIYDDDLGWCWIAGDRWAPAWVQWRRSRDASGEEVVGWAPLPPDELVVEVVDEPRYWYFVPVARIFAPRVWVTILPPRPIYFERTVIINKTVVIRDDRYRIAVNPGLEPAYIAARIGRPIRAYDVRPRVLAGVTRFEGAEVIRPGERVRERVRLRETTEVIRPADRVRPPQALQPTAEGRLGDRPPRAARQEFREERRDRREDAREQRQERREDAREERRQRREDARQQRRDQAREHERDRRDQARERDEQQRDQARERRESREERQERRENAREQRRDQRDDQRRDQARERQPAGEQRRGSREEQREQRQGQREQQEQARERAQDRREQRQESREQQREQRQGQREQQERARQRAQDRPEQLREQRGDRGAGRPEGAQRGGGRDRATVGAGDTRPQRAAPAAPQRQAPATEGRSRGSKQGGRGPDGGGSDGPGRGEARGQ
jgi:hypothetical protein